MLIWTPASHLYKNHLNWSKYFSFHSQLEAVPSISSATGAGIDYIFIFVRFCNDKSVLNVISVYAQCISLMRK